MNQQENNEAKALGSLLLDVGIYLLSSGASKVIPGDQHSHHFQHFTRNKFFRNSTMELDYWIAKNYNDFNNMGKRFFVEPDFLKESMFALYAYYGFGATVPEVVRER